MIRSWASVGRAVEVPNGEQGAYRGRDLEVSGVRYLAADHLPGDQLIDDVERRRHRGDRVADLLIAVDLVRHAASRRRVDPGGEAGEGNADLLRDHHPRLGTVNREPADDSARDVLEDLIAPALGLLDPGAPLRIVWEQRRLGFDLLERARDR